MLFSPHIFFFPITVEELSRNLSFLSEIYSYFIKGIWFPGKHSQVDLLKACDLKPRIAFENEGGPSVYSNREFRDTTRKYLEERFSAHAKKCMHKAGPNLLELTAACCYSLGVHVEYYSRKRK